MATETQYYIAEYDTEALGPFVAEGANLTWTGGVGFIITVLDEGTTGRLYIGLVSGVPPTDTLVLTQGTTTANANGNAILIDYPAYFRNDVAIAGSGATTWVGPALGATHSFFFDGQTVNVVANEILTFSGGQSCEVITVESDAGASGELSVRWISFIDTLGYPDDNDTFTGDIAGNGTLNGVVHERCYQPYHLHRLLQDLNDNGDIAGNDDLSRVDPTASSKDTPTIVNLLGNMNIDATMAQHMYEGSISQASAATLYSGVNVQVTSPNADTRPVLIKNDAIITDYWKNAFMPHSVKGKVRLLTLTRDDDVDFDGKRIKGKLLEFNDTHFIGGTTLDTGTVSLALFSGSDGNNQTAVATVAGAPYNSIVIVEGYQSVDYDNGNGATPFAFKMDFGSATSLQAHERMKYIPRRGTAELIWGRNAQYVDGINLNFPYDGESGGPLVEDEIVYWGTVLTYTGQGATSMTVGEVVTFSGGSRGRLIYQNDAGATGTMIFDMNGNDLPLATETMTGVTSGGDGTVATVGANTVAGSAILAALDDDGATGNLYCSLLTGLYPVNNSEIYGGTSNASCLVNGTPQTRTINNTFWGVYTGSNHQPNFGLAVDPTDAIVGDIMVNLLATQQLPPNNQSGVATGGLTGDTVTCYPWDGTTYDAVGDPEPNYNEATLTTALVAATSTTAVVSAIPSNTPAAGFLRIERDSDNNLDLIEYSSYTGLTYTLVGTAPSAAAIGNTVMRALIDEELAADGNVSFTSVYGAPDMKTVLKVQNGYTAVKNGPIKPSPTTPTFGSTGFEAGLTRTSDA